MLNARFDPSMLQDSSWLHWAATVPLLAAHLAGMPWTLEIAEAICLVMALCYIAQAKSLRAMAVQVRIGYLALLLLGAYPYCSWIHWVQFLGTTAMVTIGYCPLLRMLRLLPWNRSGRFDFSLLRRVFLIDPSQGGLLAFHTPQAIKLSCDSLESCSLATRYATPRTKLQ